MSYLMGYMEMIFSIINIIINLLLVIAGSFALVVYLLQEHHKISEAASLIIIQVEELQKRIREMKTFIYEGQLNATAFYESQLLYKTDYWDKYKHYFIRKMDSFSFQMFDDFYSCAAEILSQQQLMKNLQYNDFYLNQNTLMNMESNRLINAINASNDSNNYENLIEGFMANISNGTSQEQKEALKKFIRQNIQQNVFSDSFWNQYRKDQKTI